MVQLILLQVRGWFEKHEVSLENFAWPFVVAMVTVIYPHFPPKNLYTPRESA